jgi:hypothetical protein
MWRFAPPARLLADLVARRRQIGAERQREQRATAKRGDLLQQ